MQAGGDALVRGACPSSSPCMPRKQSDVRMPFDQRTACLCKSHRFCRSRRFSIFFDNFGPAFRPLSIRLSCPTLVCHRLWAPRSSAMQSAACCAVPFSTSLAPRLASRPSVKHAICAGLTYSATVCAAAVQQRRELQCLPGRIGNSQEGLADPVLQFRRARHRKAVSGRGSC